MDEAREKEIRQLMRTCRGDSCGEEHFEELQELGEALRKNEQLDQLRNFLNALGNKDRLMILNVLKGGEQCVCELEVILDKTQPSVSHHLRKLEKVGLIRGWKKGKFTFYELRKEEFKKYSILFDEKFES